MAKSAVTKKKSLAIKGILNTEDDKIMIEIEDKDPIALIDYLKDFDGDDVTISVSVTNEIV